MTSRTPAEDKAYRSGAFAFKRGKKRGDNPGHCASSAASDKYWAWFHGFDNAKSAACECGGIGYTDKPCPKCGGDF